MPTLCYLINEFEIEHNQRLHYRNERRLSMFHKSIVKLREEKRYHKIMDKEINFEILGNLIDSEKKVVYKSILREIREFGLNHNLI